MWWIDEKWNVIYNSRSLFQLFLFIASPNDKAFERIDYQKNEGSRKELLDSISWVWEIFREPKALSSGVIILKQWETVCWILTNKEALS